MKRFTGTEKWSKSWFQDLSLAQKCLWQYLCENCDAAGVWDANWRLAGFQIGGTFNAESLTAFAGRVEVLADGKVWIVSFCEFQYGQLSRECRAQNHVFRCLEKHGLLDRVQSLIHSLSDRVSNTLQETDKDKDKEEEQDRMGEQGETDSPDPKAAKRASLASLSVRVGAVMRRRAETRWSDKEKQALAKLYPLPEEDLGQIERYYAASIDPPADIRRRDLLTLLNNWTGELDRSRKYFSVNELHKPVRTI